MDASFWHQKWERGEIAFHESAVNPLLMAHFKQLNLPAGSRIFLPLCGKTRDLAELLAGGYRVVGAELSERAITELFKELDLEPEISPLGKLIRYGANNIDVLVGNIFDIAAADLGPVDAIYDRAALVALPADMRAQYTSHLIDITDAAPQLLIVYEYDQSLLAGPPFAINEKELRQHYAAAYQLYSVASRNIAGGLKGKVAAIETAWRLQKADKGR